MFKVFIDCIDYDSPYRVCTEEKVFDTISDAVSWCESNSSRRDKYHIISAYKDGIKVDINLQHALERKGIDGMKESMLSQLESIKSRINDADDVEQLKNLTTLYLSY